MHYIIGTAQQQMETTRVILMNKNYLRWFLELSTQEFKGNITQLRTEILNYHE